jgi:hypothetical protein
MSLICLLDAMATDLLITILYYLNVTASVV